MGAKYEKHRHNVGFRIVERIHEQGQFTEWEKKFKAKIAKGKIEKDEKKQNIMLVKPETYMNDSGKALLEVSKFFKINVGNVIVIHDELDLNGGTIKTKIGGGNAGHNGLRSIDQSIGKEYRRVRIGIQHPGEASRVNSHVLGNFSEEEEKWLKPLIEKISDNIHCLITKDGEKQFIQNTQT